MLYTEFPETVLTVKEVAEYLRVTPKTVYSLAKQGSLKAFRVGRAVRFRRGDVNQFIAKSAESSNESQPTLFDNGV